MPAGPQNIARINTTNGKPTLSAADALPVSPDLADGFLRRSAEGQVVKFRNRGRRESFLGDAAQTPVLEQTKLLGG